MCHRNLRSLWPPVRFVNRAGLIFHEPNSLCSQLQAQTLGLLNKNNNPCFVMSAFRADHRDVVIVLRLQLSSSLCWDWSSRHSVERFDERKKIIKINEKLKGVLNYGKE
jgi:hypothetical protein